MREIEGLKERRLPKYIAFITYFKKKLIAFSSYESFKRVSYLNFIKMK